MRLCGHDNKKKNIGTQLPKPVVFLANESDDINLGVAAPKSSSGLETGHAALNSKNKK
jgi:hypothetical protein